MKKVTLPLFLLLLQQNIQASEDQVVPATLEYNASIGSFVEATQPEETQPDIGSQEQPLVPSVSQEQPQRAPGAPRLVRQNAGPTTHS
jgi:hypothetical protein